MAPSTDRTLEPADGQSGDFFGASIDSAANLRLVGASHSDGSGESSGAAYLFVRKTPSSPWTEAAKVIGPRAAPWDLFGRGVVVLNDQLLVASPGDDSSAWNSGAIFVFDASSPRVATETLVASDPSENPGFGLVLAKGKDFVIANAPRDSENGFFSGAAYIFRREADHWEQVTKLRAPDPRVSSQFGHAISATDRAVVVGAPFFMPDWNAQPVGKAYFFEQDQNSAWQTGKPLEVDDLVPGDLFGLSVAVASRTAAVSTVAPTVYVFERAGQGPWVYVTKIQPEGGASFKRPVSLAITDRYLAVGDPWFFGSGGAVHIYRRSSPGTWRHAARIDATQSGTEFGATVGLSDQELFVSEPGAANTAGQRSGVVHSYSLRSAG